MAKRVTPARYYSTSAMQNAIYRQKRRNAASPRRRRGLFVPHEAQRTSNITRGLVKVVFRRKAAPGE